MSYTAAIGMTGCDCDHIWRAVKGSIVYYE